MKIGEAREIEFERCQCNIEISRADVQVLSAQRDKMIQEASDDRRDQGILKNTMSKIEQANKELRKHAARQKRLRARTRMDDQEIGDVFHQAGSLSFGMDGAWTARIEYRGEEHSFKCDYSRLFQKTRNVWPKRYLGGEDKKKRHRVPDYLVSYVWEEAVDPWTALVRVSAWDMFREFEESAIKHRYFNSALSVLRNKRWIYGIGRIGNTIRFVTGQSGRHRIFCLELDETMGLAKLDRRDPRGCAMHFVGAMDGARLRIPITSCYGEPLIWSKGGKVARKYGPYEKIAWHWLRDCQETTVKPENQIPLEKLRDCYKKGRLWRPT